MNQGLDSFDQAVLVAMPQFGARANVEWDRFGGLCARYDSVESLTVGLTTAMQRGVEITHLVLDKVATASEFLSFLVALPTSFRGDVLFIENDRRAFLSSVRMDDRVLYQLGHADIDFYVDVLFTSNFAPDEWNVESVAA